MDSFLTHINWIDLIVIAVLLASSIFAYFRGFTHELLSIGGWVLSLVLALQLFPFLTPYITPYIADELIAQIAAGAAIFFVTLVIAGLISSWIANRVLDSRISALDRSLGFLYGLIRGGVLVSIAFLIMHQVLGEGTRPAMVETARATPFAAEGGRLLIRAANTVLPAHMHMDAPDSAFGQMQNDARQLLEEKTAPIRRLNDLADGVKKATQNSADPSYTAQDSEQMKALIEKETSQ